MSEGSIVTLVGVACTLLAGAIAALLRVTYQVGRVYSLVAAQLHQHDHQLKQHDRRIGALERPRPASS